MEGVEDMEDMEDVEDVEDVLSGTVVWTAAGALRNTQPERKHSVQIRVMTVISSLRTRMSLRICGSRSLPFFIWNENARSMIMQTDYITKRAHKSIENKKVFHNSRTDLMPSGIGQTKGSAAKRSRPCRVPYQKL